MRRSIPLLFVLIAVLNAAAVSRADDAPRPNILLILADDLGFGDLSCYGATDLRTPNIDALAERGMRFDNFYASCPVCSPTRAALMTGRYPDLVGVPGVIRTHAENNWGYLHPDAVLLPQPLGQAGYRTALVGKWHLGLESPNTPNERGFDHFHGFLGDMMDDYYDHRRHDINYMRLNDQIIEPEGHATDLFSEWAAEWLRQQSAEQPFFLYLAYNAPHTPIQPPEDWLEQVRRREPQMTEKRAKLVALIEHMDAGIGRVLQALAESGLAENTLVIFTSDNGGQSNVGANNGPWRDGKGSVYEGGLRVPAIAAWPGRTESGSHADLVALSMDLYPTIAAAAGAKVDHEIEGRSLLPTLVGERQQPLRDEHVFRRREGGLQFNGKTIDAVRRGDWKLLQNSPFGPMELYDLKDDPYEQHNLADRERRVYQDLAASLRRHFQRAGAVPWQKQESDAESAPRPSQ